MMEKSDQNRWIKIMNTIVLVCQLDFFFFLIKPYIIAAPWLWFHFPGKAEGVIFEDDGDGYGYTQAAYLLTYYVAEQQDSIITVKVSKTEGSWKRPKRALHVHVLLGGGAMVCLYSFILFWLLIPLIFWLFSRWFIICSFAFGF